MKKIVAIQDVKMGTFQAPHAVIHMQEALRGFEAIVNGEKNNSIAKYPEDHILFEIGEFDEDTGDLKNHTKNINMGNGADFVKRKADTGVTTEDEGKGTFPNKNSRLLEEAQKQSKAYEKAYKVQLKKNRDLGKMLNLRLKKQNARKRKNK